MDLLATISAAPPSARRAHSSCEVAGATLGELSTSSRERLRRVSADGCRVACRDMRTETIANCSRVTRPLSMCHRAMRSYPLGMHGDGRGDSGLRHVSSARCKNSAVSSEETASPATTATAWHRSVCTMRTASSNPLTGPAPPVSMVRTRTPLFGSRPTRVAKKCASIKCGCEREGTATRPSSSRSFRPDEPKAACSASCMSSFAVAPSFPSRVIPWPTMRAVT